MFREIRFKFLNWSAKIAIFAVLLISISSEVGLALPPPDQGGFFKRCGQALRLNSSRSQKFFEDRKQALNRIVGRVHFDFRPNGKMESHYLPDIDTEGRRNVGSGDELVKSLSNHYDPTSPTSLRVEEKAVVSNQSFHEFLNLTQSESFRQKAEITRPIIWELRDTPPQGKKFVTVTEYGRNLSFNLNEGKSNIIVKPRYRKYYTVAKDENPTMENSEPVLGNITAVELKITSLSGAVADEFLGISDTVFKPRLMATDEVADMIKHLNGERPDIDQRLEEIKQAAKQLTNERNEPLNSPELVDSFMGALKLILEIDPLILNPEFVVKYERSSFKTRTQRGEFQFTADKGISIYLPVRGLETSRMNRYLSQIPIFNSGDDEVFVEIKSPVDEKVNETPLYQSFITSMIQSHIPTYKRGQGKYAIARRVDQTLHDKNLDQILLKEGVFYWMVKGTGNLDVLPKKNEILAEEVIKLAFPFPVKDGRIFKLFLRYDSRNLATGRHAVLSKIRLIDDFGSEIKVQPGFDSLLSAVLNRHSSEVVSIDIDGLIVPFKPMIHRADINKYKSFFERFFEYETHIANGRRFAGDFDNVQNARGLRRLNLKTKIENLYYWTLTRSGRAIFGAALIAGLLHYQDQIAPLINTVTESVFDTRTSGLEEALQNLQGLKDSSGREIELKAHFGTEGRILFTVRDHADEFELNNGKMILYDGEGNPIHFLPVQFGSKGKVYFDLIRAGA